MAAAGTSSSCRSARPMWGRPGGGRPGGMSAHDLDALRLEAEEHAHRDRGEDTHEVGRQAPVEAPHDEHDRDDAQATARVSGSVSPRRRSVSPSSARVSSCATSVMPDEAVQLAHDHHDGRAGHVSPRAAAGTGSGSRSRGARCPRGPAGCQPSARPRRRAPGSGSVALGERRDDRRGEERDRGLRAHAHLAHAAHEGVASSAPIEA